MSTRHRRKSKNQRGRETKKLSAYKRQFLVESISSPEYELGYKLFSKAWSPRLPEYFHIDEDEARLLRRFLSLVYRDIDPRTANPEVLMRLGRLENLLSDTHVVHQSDELDVGQRQVQSKELANQDSPTLEAATKIQNLPTPEPCVPPQLGERILLLILTKQERINIPGDLEEEFRQIAAKHGARYAKLWYYKQVAASAWPMIRKATGWGILAWAEEWIRRRVQ